MDCKTDWRQSSGRVGLVLSQRRRQRRRCPIRFRLRPSSVTLLELNDARHRQLHRAPRQASKPFRDQFPPDRLKEVFKAFRQPHRLHHCCQALIATEEPKVMIPARAEGCLIPILTSTDLDFIMSDGERKAIKINVRLENRRPMSGILNPASIRIKLAKDWQSGRTRDLPSRANRAPSGVEIEQHLRCAASG